MKKLKCLIFSLTLGTTVLLSGCIGPTYRYAASQVSGTHQQIQASRRYNADVVQPAVVVRAGFYIDQAHHSLHHPPQWLNRHVEVRSAGMPLNRLMSRLFAGQQIGVTYTRNTHSLVPISINYHGTMAGVLERIARRLNYNYVSTEHGLAWSAFQTKVFNISFMPGSTDYMVGQGQQAHGMQSHGTTNASHGLSNDQQYSSLVGNLSVWRDLQRTLKQLKSSDGKVVISEATSSVTVNDYPNNVRTMAHYIAQMNHLLSQEVLIKVQVLDVSLNRQFASGINWDVIAHVVSGSTSTSLNLKGGMFDKVSPFSFATGSSIPGLIVSQTGGQSQTLIHALEQQGDVSTVTEPRVVTLNNQPSSIRITQNTGYLKSISITSAANVGTTASVTPGVVSEGFTLYLLPKIEGRDVLMQISSHLSNLLKITPVSTGPIFQPPSDASKTQAQSSEMIQVPTTTEKSFNQRSMIPTGHTLVVAGFKRLSNHTENASQFKVLALGGTGAQTQNIETVILITPVILRQDN